MPVPHMCILHASQDPDAAGIPHISHITHTHTVTAKVIIASLWGKSLPPNVLLRTNRYAPVICKRGGPDSSRVLASQFLGLFFSEPGHAAVSKCHSVAQKRVCKRPAVVWCTVLWVAISPSDMPDFAGAKVWAPRVRRLLMVLKTICPPGQGRCRRSWYRVWAARCARWSIRCTVTRHVIYTCLLWNRKLNCHCEDFDCWACQACFHPFCVGLAIFELQY